MHIRHVLVEVGLVSQVVVVSAETCRQLHETAAREEDRIMADGQHLCFLGQVVVGCQVVGQCRRVNLVGVQRVGHRTQRKMMRGQHRATLRNHRRHPGMVPLDGIPAAADGRAVADEQRDEAVGVAVHRLRLGIDRSPCLAVGDAHSHFHILVIHQLVRAVAHHRLVTDFVVLGQSGERQNGHKNCKK